MPIAGALPVAAAARQNSSEAPERLVLGFRGLVLILQKHMSVFDSSVEKMKDQGLPRNALVVPSGQLDVVLSRIGCEEDR